jgi:hypothetical protein
MAPPLTFRYIQGPPSTQLRQQGRGEWMKTQHTKQESLRGIVMTLEQACPSEYQGAQCAFKDSMIH